MLLKHWLHFMRPLVTSLGFLAIFIITLNRNNSIRLYRNSETTLHRNTSQTVLLTKELLIFCPINHLRDESASLVSQNLFKKSFDLFIVQLCKQIIINIRIIFRRKISKIEGRLYIKSDEERVASILLSSKYNKRVFIICKVFRVFVICVKRLKHSLYILV